MERLVIDHLASVKELSELYCDIPQMDDFIHNGGLEQSVRNNYCKAYSVKNEAGELVAFFALSFDSLRLDADDMEVLQNGWTDTSVPQPTAEYMDTFWSKVHYPALEIAYLAVAKKHQHKDIGTYIVKKIREKALSQNLAGCQFLTVGALVLPEYSAVGFYRKCQFAQLDTFPVHDVVRMYHNLLTK